MSDNQQFCLRWNNHQSTLVQVIDSLLSSGVLVDCTLAAEGQFLNAHKVVLCACSPYLEALLSQHYEKHPIVILKDVKFQELKSMMDYMYKGEVNISQDQLGQFLKAAESLQIKGLTDGGGENDSRDVGSTSQKRHEPTPVRKTAVPHQSRSPLVLPSHSTGLTIEPSKRTLPTHLSESQPDSPIRSREGSSSPTSRKRRRQRRPSQGDEDGHQDNSCDLPMQAQTMSITTVPTSIPPIPTGSSSTITKAPPPDDDSENPENDRLSGIPADGFIKEKIEPQPEMLIEPKTEYMEETNNDDSVEDLTLDDDDDYENMMEGGPGPSHSANNPNENYAAWQQMTGDRQDEAYLNPADTGHRDSQGAGKSAAKCAKSAARAAKSSTDRMFEYTPTRRSPVIDLSKSPTCASIAIRISEVSSAAAAAPQCHDVDAEDDDGVIDLEGDEDDYTIDLLDDLVINGDTLSDSTDAMDDATESDDDVVVIGEGAAAAVPNGDHYPPKTPPSTPLSATLAKMMSSPSAGCATSPLAGCVTSLSAPCATSPSAGCATSPLAGCVTSLSAPCVTSPSAARVIASASCVTSLSAPCVTSPSAGCVTSPSAGRISSPSTGCECRMRSPVAAAPNANIQVPRFVYEIPNAEIDVDTLKKYQLKNFSIRLSKNQCFEAIRNQEKLNFLEYFRVVERGKLSAKAGLVKPAIRRGIYRKYPLGGRGGAACLLNKHKQMARSRPAPGVVRRAYKSAAKSAQKTSAMIKALIQS